jgi:hypothetical protein
MVFFSEQPLQAVTPPQNLETLKSLIAHDTEDAGPTLGSSLDLTTPTTPTQPRVTAAPASTAAAADDADGLRPLEHDMVIWLGDLNYRLDMGREDIVRAAERGDWDTLHASDQLRYVRLAAFRLGRRKSWGGEYGRASADLGAVGLWGAGKRWPRATCSTVSTKRRRGTGPRTSLTRGRTATIHLPSSGCRRCATAWCGA